MTRKRPRLKLRSLYLWHRYIGAGVALLLVLLAGTGVLLNHTETLKLDQRFVTAEPLLNWYGIGTPEAIVHFSPAGHQISQLSGHLYVDGERLAGEFAPLRGALSRDDLLLVALGDALLLLLDTGEQVDRLAAPGHPSNRILALGLDPTGNVVIETENGHYKSDSGITAWQALTDAPPAIGWSIPGTPPRSLALRIGANERNHLLHWERVLLDIHSGRILGDWGVLIMDAAALAMLLLAFSGLLLWLNQIRKRKQHRRRQRRF